MKSHWTVITVVVIILTLSVLAFFTYLEKPPSQTETPDGSTPESQEPDSLMRQVFETIEELKKIIEKDPKNMQALITLVYLFDKKDDKKAVWAWKKFIALSPDDPHVQVIKDEMEKLEKKLK